MQRNVKILIFSFISLILTVLIIYNIFSHFNFFRKNLTIVNKTVYSNLLPEDNFKSVYTSKIKFSDRPIAEITDVKLNILNKIDITNAPMILKAQRYYVSLSFISKELNYTFDNSNSSFLLSNNDNKISITENSYTKNSLTGFLRGNLINYNDT